MFKNPVYISCTCPICGEVNEVLVEYSDYFAWYHDDLLVQEAFPYLSADDRELLITGICPTCWNHTFGMEDE